MAIFYVTNYNTNERTAVNTVSISRILDKKNFREMYYGTGNLGINTLPIKETITKILTDTKFLSVTENNSKRGAAVNGSLVSYIRDQGGLREIWFGPQSSPTTPAGNTSLLPVVEDISYLSSNSGLVLLNDANNGRKVAVNPNLVYMIENKGGTRSIYFGPVNRTPGIVSVKETIQELENLGVV